MKSSYAFTLAQARKCVFPYPVYEAYFADGTVQRMSVWQPKGKPWNFDHARNVAQGPHGTRLMINGHILHGGNAFRDPLFSGDVVAKPKKRTTAAQMKAVLQGVLDGDQMAIDEAQALVAA